MRSVEVGDFLRSRRRRVDPVSAGFPPDRRRTPGLRREELAVLAGITVSWLTKLEQGHAHSVSPEVLESLARALGLDDAERSHLFALAGYRVGAAATHHEPVSDALRAVLLALEPNPAYLLDARWDIVAWNDAEARLFPKLATFAGRSPNLLELVFLDADLARLMVDHDEEMTRLVEQLRLHSGDRPEDPELERLVARLAAASPAFAARWDAKNVSPFATTRRVFDHPTAGRIEMDHHRFAVLEHPGMQLVVYTPAPVTAGPRSRPFAHR